MMHNVRIIICQQSNGQVIDPQLEAKGFKSGFHDVGVSGVRFATTTNSDKIARHFGTRSSLERKGNGPPWDEDVAESILRISKMS